MTNHWKVKWLCIIGTEFTTKAHTVCLFCKSVCCLRLVGWALESHMVPAVCVLQAVCMCVWVCVCLSGVYVCVTPSVAWSPAQSFSANGSLRGRLLGGMLRLIVNPCSTHTSRNADHIKIFWCILGAAYIDFLNQCLQWESENCFCGTNLRGRSCLKSLYLIPIVLFSFYPPVFLPLSSTFLRSVLYAAKSQSKMEVEDFHPTVRIRSKRWIWAFKRAQSLRSHFRDTVFLTALRLKKCFAEEQAWKSL